MIIKEDKITFEDILAKVSEEDIFRNYISDFVEVGKMFCSPFKKETNPSCSVFSRGSRLFYKDFSSGNGGDCFNLIQVKYNCNYQESLNIVAGDFGIRKKMSYSTMIPGIIPKNTTQVIKETKIKIRSCPWSKEGLDYWKQYHINQADLEYYKVHQIDYYWINYDRFKCKTVAFAYDFNWYKPYSYQILQPYEERVNKWYSNTDSKLVMGLNYLPENGELLIITSSYKDFITLSKLGYFAISPKSESTLIPEIVLTDLATRFDNIITWMNNDDIGLKYKAIYEDKYGILGVVNPIEWGKDPSDAVKNGYDIKILI